jgi:PII-like signaling protein
VNEDCLKLTTYFGERHRTERGLVADELLELYGRQGVEVSVLLRGIEGFGVKHHLRTDRLLTLSEDLPVVSVAVDTRTRITDLLDEVLAIKRHGLVTLERARMLSGTVTAIALPRDVHEAAKLTIYVGRQERIHGRPAFMAVTDLLRSRGIDGVTTLLGVDGTAHGVRRRARFFARNANVPLMIIAVGASERIGAVLPELAALLPHPLVTLERVRVCKRGGTLLTRPQAIAGRDPSGLPVWQKLMVYTSEAAAHDDTPVHVALVRALRAQGARGATSLRGIWGFHGDSAPHGDRLLQLRRRVPVVTVVIDAPERIQSAFDTVDRITAETGLVTSELVPAAAEIQDGEQRSALSLARPDPDEPH